MEGKRVLPRPINTAEEYLRALLEEIEGLRADLQASTEKVELTEVSVEPDATAEAIAEAMKVFVGELKRGFDELQRSLAAALKTQPAVQVSVSLDEEKLADAIAAAIKRTKSDSARKKKQPEPKEPVSSDQPE